MNSTGRKSKILCLIGSSILFIIAVFHGSGFNYVNSLVLSSDVPDFIKEVFPVLFILPSLQLLGLATFGFIAPYLKDTVHKILIPLSIFILADAALAIYLDALIPALVLALSACLFVLSIFFSRVG